MTYEIVSVLCGGEGFKAPGDDLVYRQLDNRCNDYTPCQLYQQGLMTSRADVIIYAHDDVSIHEPLWLQDILNTMGHAEKDGRVCAVGLGGALSLGNTDLYRKPYDIRNMARGYYMSNQTDAKVHGDRYVGERPVAVLDAFLMAVRRDFLELVGGWPTEHLTHHCLDLWLACQAARSGYEIWMTGVYCTHHGGGSSTKPVYREAKWLQGGTLESDHQEPHRWLYEEYRDVLPIRVE